MIDFDPVQLQQRLNRLLPNLQLAFGALVCERLLPNYQHFQRESEWGDWAPLRESMDTTWMVLSGRTVKPEDISRLSARCEMVAPDSEDFNQLTVASAQDACCAVCCLLNFILQPDVEQVVQVATYAVDTIDLYVQEVSNMDPADPALEEKILSHPLMRQELEFQDEVLQALESTASLSVESISNLRSTFGGRTLSNLGLS